MSAGPTGVSHQYDARGKEGKSFHTEPQARQQPVKNPRLSSMVGTRRSLCCQLFAQHCSHGNTSLPAGSPLLMETHCTFHLFSLCGLKLFPSPTAGSGSGLSHPPFPSQARTKPAALSTPGEITSGALSLARSFTFFKRKELHGLGPGKAICILFVFHNESEVLPNCEELCVPVRDLFALTQAAQ